MVRPDPVRSSVAVKSEQEIEEPAAPQSLADIRDDDDPIVREIGVYISPELANKLHLLQFPIQPAAPANKSKQYKQQRQPEPIDAKFRPQHRMLELQYEIPNHAKGVPDRPLPDTMCLSSRTFTSSHISPVTNMALAKLSKDGTRLDVVPMQTSILQMRPSFDHLHMHDDDEEDNTQAESETNNQSSGRKSLLQQKKEAERSASQRRNSYAYKRASEESEDWIQLEVHGNTRDGGWTEVKKDYMEKVKCRNRNKDLLLGMTSNEGYVRSLNYLDSMAAASSFASAMNEDLSDWKPSSKTDTAMEDDEEIVNSTPVGETEKAAAELAAKLVVLLQNGDGAMIPYRVIRSRLNEKAISDEVLTMALSSCTVLVRGNFCLKSSLTQFINVGGSGNARGRAMRELRDFILLLLNMHGMVQRERLIRVYKEIEDDTPNIINPDTIILLLQTVARRSDTENCWLPKVDDDELFSAKFPEVAALHGVYWLKKKNALKNLVEIYEGATDDNILE